MDIDGSPDGTYNGEQAPVFEFLPDETRHEVRRLAKQGQLHPDPVIKESSLEFAYRKMDVGKACVALVWLLEAVAPSGQNDWGVVESPRERFANWRAAKRIVRLAERNGGWAPSPRPGSFEDGPKVRADDLIRRERAAEAASDPDG
jgi:hypothetical protein